jgi:hypothetical protein
MSEAEDAAVTVARLLQKNLRVVKDDGNLADIYVSTEWQNTDAFKDSDGQVTVGLAEAADQKLELSGKNRRRMSILRVNVWTAEQVGALESARAMRGKIVEEVNRVLRQNRAHPNVTVYDFYNLGAASQTHKAYHGAGEAPPDSSLWAELSSENYANLWASDNAHCQVSSLGSGEYAAMLFRFKVESREKTVKQITLTFEGYGSAPTQNGVTVEAWNHLAQVWQNSVTGSAQDEDETVSVTLTQDLPSFIDADGYVWFFARTSSPSDGAVSAVLHCDYVSCTVTVNGVTYCDVVSYRPADRVDIKPFVFRTEFTVKSWFFENLGV